MSSDKYGADELPAAAAIIDETKGEHAPDRALDAIGAYLKAVLTSDLGEAWAAVAPGQDIVVTTFTVNPKNALVNGNQLPALFLWRGPFQSSREAEAYLITRTQVGVVWLLWWPDALKRERLLPFQGIVTKTCHEALARGRHTAWYVDGDASPGSFERGSVLAKQAGLFRPLDQMSGSELDITLEPDKTGAPVAYKALSLTVPIEERMFRDPASWFDVTSTADPDNVTPDFRLAAALDLTLTQGDNAIEQLQPKP